MARTLSSQSRRFAPIKRERGKGQYALDRVPVLEQHIRLRARLGGDHGLEPRQLLLQEARACVFIVWVVVWMSVRTLAITQIYYIYIYNICHTCPHTKTNTDISNIHMHMRTRDVVRVRVRVDSVEGLEPHLLQQRDIARDSQVDGVDDNGLLACLFFGGFVGWSWMRRGRNIYTHYTIHIHYMYTTHGALSGSAKK